MGIQFRKNLVAASFLLFAATFTLAAARQRPAGGAAGSKSAGQPAAIGRGKTIYRDRCEICHFSGSDAKKIGPGLKAIYSKGKFADGKKVDDAGMQKWVEKGGKDMPPFQNILKPDQIRDLIAYIKTL